MWRRIHIFEPMQAFALASVCAAIIALPFTIRSVSHDDTSWLRDLFWPHTLDPYITFSWIFIGVLLALLGYYHLGRLGFLLNAAAGFGLSWTMAVFGILCFACIGRHFNTVWLGTVAYAACWLLLYLLTAVVHSRAATSATVRDAQRKLRLLSF